MPFPDAAPSDPSGWPLVTDHSVEDLAAGMLASGVDAAVLVQGWAAYGYDNSYAIDAAAAAPAERFVSACAVDTEDSDAPEHLRSWAARSRMRGVRIVGGWMGDGATLLSDGPQAVWATSAELGIPVLAFAYADRIDTVAEAARRHDVPAILDHCGFVELPGDVDVLEPLASVDHIALKVSSRVLGDRDAPAIVRALADLVGADRLMWASDYPASHERSYGKWVEVAREATRRLSSAEAEAFLGGTALRYWPELG